MIKKISVFIVVLGLVFVGIDQFNVKPVKANVVNNSFVIGSNYWENWSATTPPNNEPYTEIMSYDFGSGLQKSFLWAMKNKTAWFGSRHWFISLRSGYEYTWVSAPNWESNNGIYDFTFAFDLLEIRTNSIIFYYNGYIIEEQSFEFLSSLFGDGTSEEHFYLVRNIENDLQENYNDGYNDGYNFGLNEGYDSGYDDGANDYGIIIEDDLINAGLYGELEYLRGLNDSDTTYSSVFDIISNAIFAPIALIFGIELLPNITLGMIILVPLVFGLIAFIVGGKKK